MWVGAFRPDLENTAQRYFGKILLGASGGRTIVVRIAWAVGIYHVAFWTRPAKRGCAGVMKNLETPGWKFNAYSRAST